jgi:hypothetical protein
MSLAYLLISLPTGIAYLAIAVTGISLSAGLSVLIVGLPLLLGFLGTVRALAVAERRLLEYFLGVPMRRRAPAARVETGPFRRALYRLKERRTWTTLLYLLLQGPLGTVYSALVSAGLCASVWLVAAPILEPLLGDSRIPLASGGYLVLEPWEYPLISLGGVALFLVTVHGVRGIARGHAAYAKDLLLSGEAASLGAGPS